MKSYYFFILPLFFSFSVISAPYPATSTSEIIQGAPYFKSNWGFEIVQNTSGWSKVLPKNNNPFLLAIYKPVLSAPESDAQLSVRVDPFPETKKRKYHLRLKNYVNYWTKQFPKFGIEVMDIKYRLQNTYNTAIIDSFNTAERIKIRQYVFWKKDKALLLACKDSQRNFNTTQFSCNQIIESFRWL